MLISHLATSAGVASRPRFGVSWAALPVYPTTAISIITTTVKLRVDIFHLAVCFHLPRLDGVVVVGDIDAMRGHQGVARRLERTRITGGAALQHGWSAVPLPCHAEARQCFGQHRGGQRRLSPGLPTIG